MAAPNPNPNGVRDRNDDFLLYVPAPGLTIGVITAEFYALWHRAEGGGRLPIKSATRLTTFFPEPWASWARSLLRGMTEDDPDGVFHVYFPSFLVAILTQWVENSSHPNPPPFILIPYVPRGHMVYQPNAIPEPPVDNPVDPVPPPPIPVIDLTASPEPTPPTASLPAIPPPPTTAPPPIPPPPPGLWNLHVDAYPTPPSPTPEIPLWDQDFVPFGTHDHEAGTSATATLDHPNPTAISPPRPAASPTSPVRVKCTVRISIPRHSMSSFCFDHENSSGDEEMNSPREHSEREWESEPSEDSMGRSWGEGSHSPGDGSFGDYLSS